MKIKLDKEENVLIVLCERKKANLKIIYKLNITKDTSIDKVLIFTF